MYGCVANRAQWKVKGNGNVSGRLLYIMKVSYVSLMLSQFIASAVFKIRTCDIVFFGRSE